MLPISPVVRVGCVLFLYALFAIGCRPGEAEPDRYVLPAEWENHDAVWVTFVGGPMDEVVFEMVEAIARHTPVKCVVPGIDYHNNPSHRLAYTVRARLETMGVDPGKIEIIRSDQLVQVRDTGPIFVRNATGDLQVVDFRWNNYGDPAALSADYQDPYPFDSLMAARLQIPTIRSTVVMEGGALETNGSGTLLQVEAVTLQRNPGMTKEAIETELKRVLGQKKVVWLKEGTAEDPQGLAMITENYLGSGVGGHVDEFARFVNATTILLAFPDSAEAARDPVKKITYERMQVNYEILRNETDQDGNPFEIVKVPVPEVPYEPIVVDAGWTHPSFRSLLEKNPQIRHGDTLHWVPASSYLNYFVTNGLVLIPAYWQPGLPASVREKDEQFRQLVAQYYPDREILPLRPQFLNNNGGGIHCWTLQQPARR